MLGIETNVDPLLPDEQSDKPTKRIRLQNFTERENELLVNLVNQKVAIIENKTSQPRSNTLKHEVWRAITEVFNSHRIGEPRDHTSLRYRYENLKRKLRKKVVDQKEVLAEGEIVQLMTTNYETKLWEMMAYKPDGVEILKNGVIEVVGKGSRRQVQFVECFEDDEQAEFSDCISNEPTFDPKFNDPCVAPVSPLIIKGEASRGSNKDVSDDEMELSNGPSTASTSATTNPTSSTNNIVVSPSKCRQYLNSFRRLLDETVDANSESDDGNKRREEEHQLKMKFMKDEHEAKMKLLAQELRMKEEEHDFRMKILKRKLFVIIDDI